MGDLLFVNRHPYLPDGFPSDWIRALERVSALDVRVAVPGHGALGNASNFAEMISYMRTIEDIGNELAKRNATDREIASQPVPPAFRKWWFSRFFLPNVKYMMSLAKEQQPRK